MDLSVLPGILEDRMISALMMFWNFLVGFVTNKRKPIISHENRNQTIVVSNNQSGGIVAANVNLDGFRFDSDRDECTGCVTLSMPGAECDVMVFTNPKGEKYVSTGRHSGQLVEDAIKESNEYLASLPRGN